MATKQTSPPPFIPKPGPVPIYELRPIPGSLVDKGIFIAKTGQRVLDCLPSHLTDKTLREVCDHMNQAFYDGIVIGAYADIVSVEEQLGFDMDEAWEASSSIVDDYFEQPDGSLTRMDDDGAPQPQGTNNALFPRDFYGED